MFNVNLLCVIDYWYFSLFSCYKKKNVLFSVKCELTLLIEKLVSKKCYAVYGLPTKCKLLGKKRKIY